MGCSLFFEDSFEYVIDVVSHIRNQDVMNSADIRTDRYFWHDSIDL